MFTFTAPGTGSHDYFLARKHQSGVRKNSRAGEIGLKKHTPDAPVFGSFRNLLTYPRTKELGDGAPASALGLVCRQNGHRVMFCSRWFLLVSLGSADQIPGLGRHR